MQENGHNTGRGLSSAHIQRALILSSLRPTDTSPRTPSVISPIGRTVRGVSRGAVGRRVRIGGGTPMRWTPLAEVRAAAVPSRAPCGRRGKCTHAEDVCEWGPSRGTQVELPCFSLMRQAFNRSRPARAEPQLKTRGAEPTGIFNLLMKHELAWPLENPTGPRGQQARQPPQTRAGHAPTRHPYPAA